MLHALLVAGTSSHALATAGASLAVSNLITATLMALHSAGIASAVLASALRLVVSTVTALHPAGIPFPPGVTFHRTAVAVAIPIASGAAFVIPVALGTALAISVALGALLVVPVATGASLVALSPLVPLQVLPTLAVRIPVHRTLPPVGVFLLRP
ncbi:MAG: hypothetical protein MK085_04090 [Phycisphaerales bacterium]|nr:hypothetical protein [Phycisphaerales bacterium]